MKKAPLLTVLSISVFIIGALSFFYFRKTDPIKIGFLGTFSGRNAIMSVQARNGVLLALDQFNSSKQTINGRSIQLIVKDLHNKDEEIHRTIDQLAKEGVSIVIGPLTSNMALSSIARAKEYGMLLLSPTVSTQLISNKNDNFIRLSPDTYQQGNALAQALIQDDVDNIAVVYDSHNKEYSEEMYLAIKKTLSSANKNIIYVSKLKDKDDEFYYFYAEQLVKANPEAIVLIASGLESGLLLQALGKLGYKGAIYGSMWTKTNDFIQNGGRYVEGAKLISFFQNQEPTQQFYNFDKLYKLKYHSNYSFVAEQSYSLMNIVLAALFKIKNDDSELVKKFIIQQGRFEGLQKPYFINEFGDVSEGHTLTQVNRGEYVFVQHLGVINEK